MTVCLIRKPFILKFFRLGVVRSDHNALKQTHNAIVLNCFSYPADLIELCRALAGHEVQTFLHWPTLSRHRSSFK